ncbi:MAG: hypothetical protein AAB468_00675 [Patescibacteria group bacterium]
MIELWCGGQAISQTEENFSGEIFRFRGPDISLLDLEQAIVGGDLWSRPRLVVLEEIASTPLALETVVNHLSTMAASPHRFVWREDSPSAELVRQIKDVAGRIVEAKPRPAAKNNFNIFALADACLRRDRRGLWLELLAARAAGLQPEEIFWKLFWPIKNMLLVKTSPLAPASLKPFVLDKARGGAAHYRADELQSLSWELVKLYHEAHLGRRDLDLALERWVLEL